MGVIPPGQRERRHRQKAGLMRKQAPKQVQIKYPIWHRVAVQAARDQNEDALVYICPSCGAEVVTDATTAATFCYYCHNPVVLSGKLSGEFLPDYVIPFAMDKKTSNGDIP